MNHTCDAVVAAATMSRALRGIDLGDASRRAAAYVAAGIDPVAIHRLDARAVAAETARRALFPAPLPPL